MLSMLDPDLQKYIIDSYPEIDNILSVTVVEEGYLSQNYVLHTSKEKLFLKQYRDRYSGDQVKEIHKVIQFFSDKGIQSVSPIENIDKNTYFVFNSHGYCLFPFLSGTPGDRKHIAKNSIKSLAKTLAKIHLLSSDGIPIKISREQGAIDRRKFLDAYPEIVKVIESKKQIDDFDKLALKVLKLKKSIVDKSMNQMKDSKTFNTHLLHGDYHEKNVFFDDNGDVKYIFDWEKTKIGNRLHELIRSMDYICLDGDYGDVNIEKARLYIQTYMGFYPFDKEDFINAIQDYYLKNAHSLWIERTHYLENSNRVDCFLENELALLNYYPKNYNRIIDGLGL